MLGHAIRVIFEKACWQELETAARGFQVLHHVLHNLEVDRIKLCHATFGFQIGNTNGVPDMLALTDGRKKAILVDTSSKATAIGGFASLLRHGHFNCLALHVLYPNYKY